MEQLKRLGKPESELGSMLKSVADLRSDLSQFTFVRCDARTRVARLLYRRESVGPQGPMLELDSNVIARLMVDRERLIALTSYGANSRIVPLSDLVEK